jgi:hypothetical protein
MPSPVPVGFCVDDSARGGIEHAGQSLPKVRSAPI